MHLIEAPSPNFDARTAPPDMLVLHYTGMKTGEEALARLRDPEARVSSHYMVEEDGRVFRLVPEARRAWHAGVSSWQGEQNCNATSIGVEIVNPGHEWGYRACPGVLEDVMAGLFHVAKADGVVTDDELKFLERVAELFGISPMTWRRIRAEHIGAPADDVYVILGVAPDATDAEVHAAWKRALLDLHPDRAAALGLSPAAAEAAEARAAAINAAHDQVMRERNAWAAAELA